MIRINDYTEILLDWILIQQRFAAIGWVTHSNKQSINTWAAAWTNDCTKDGAMIQRWLCKYFARLIEASIY